MFEIKHILYCPKQQKYYCPPYRGDISFSDNIEDALMFEDVSDLSLYQWESDEIKDLCKVLEVKQILVFSTK